MKAQRYTLEQIAEILGYADKSGARKAVQRGLAAVSDSKSLREGIAVQLLQCDFLETEILEVMGRRHYVVSQKGTLVYEGDGDVPLIDDTVKLGAVDRMVKVMEYRAKLEGYFAPTKNRIEVVAFDEFAESMKALTEEVGDLRNEADASSEAQAPV